MIHPVVIIISIFAVIIVSALGTALIRRRIFIRTYGALMTRDYPAFFREVDSKGMMSMFPEYVRDNLKLTAYMEMKDSGKVTEMFNRMMKGLISLPDGTDGGDESGGQVCPQPGREGVSGFWQVLSRHQGADGRRQSGGQQGSPGLPGFPCALYSGLSSNIMPSVRM